MIIKNAMLNFAYDYQFSGNTNNNNNSNNESVAEINEEIISESVDTAQTYMQTNTAYNSTGNYITSETDEAGHTTSYSYDSDGNKTSVTDPKNNTTSYTYDTYGNILSVASGSSSYNNTYTSTGQLSTISNSGTSYSFEYDNFDNVTKVKVGTQTLVTNTYDSLCDKLTRVTYGNGQSLIYTYDDYGRITGIDVHNGTLARYSYNKKGLITKYEDKWLRQITYFFYDCNGNMIAKYAESEDKDLAFNISFDSNGNTVEQTNVNGRLQNIIRGTDDEENEYVSYDGIKVTTETDDFGRTTKTDTHYEGDLDYSPFYTTYGYKNGSATNSTTNIVNSVKHYTKTASNYPDHKIAQYDYTYDSNGNITQVTLNDTVIAKYTYDSLNQLSTSADKNANEFVEYTYDTKGNITQKKNYSLTSSLTKGTLKDTKTYTYGDTNWGDKLTSYNGTTITYDNIGNPTSYRDGMTMSWMVGRSLSQITKSNKTYSFKYNADGLRTEKKCVTDGDTHHYYYDSNGNMIAFRRNNAAVVYFYYDSQGNVTSMSFEGTKYFFIKNIQGDVEKIVTHQGNVAVTYKYDAWGKLISKTDNTVYGIGELNPFRYRGYIYDDETGLYYLKSRYYDPITGRFLNADDTAILLMTSNISRNNNEVPSLGMSNLFAYCENNPIKYTDPDGYVTPANVIGAVIGGIIGAIGGFFLTNWLADKLKLHGWKRNLFVWGLTAVITAAAAVIGYFIGPYVARIAVKLGRFVVNLVKKGKIVFKRLSSSVKSFVRTLIKHTCCFVSGTCISTPKGNQRIEDIKVGSKVYSENPKNGKIGIKRVTKVFVRQTNILYHVFTDKDEIITTSEHPFWIESKGWIAAKNLLSGYILHTQNEGYTEIVDVKIECHKQPVNVYNFEVQDWHTYFVGDEKVLVHNKCQLTKIKDSFLKQKGLDAHAIKREVLGKNAKISQYNLFYDKKDKAIFVLKNGAKEAQKIFTGYFLK